MPNVPACAIIALEGLAARTEAEMDAAGKLNRMAAGVAVVATRVGGTPLLVGSDGDQWLCKPGDVDALAERLIRLLNDSALRNGSGQAMMARVERYFDIKKIASSYAIAYERLQQGRRDELSSCRLTWPGA